MEEDSSSSSSRMEAIQKSMKDLADGRVGHEIEALTTKGMHIVKAHKGYVLSDFIIHRDFSDENGNWHVGAIATLVDLMGSTASFTIALHPQVTLDLTISYYSTAKVQEEVEVEAKVVAKKNKLSSVIVEVRRKDNKEVIAMGKLWMAVAKSNAKRQTSSKL